MKYSLNGQWFFKNASDNGDFYPAFVPSTNYSDLLNNNLIPDPFVKLNEKETVWVGDKNWLYRKTFKIGNEILKEERIELVADCIDAISEIYLNENLVAKTFNAHLGYRFDVKPYLQEGINTLDILFLSPVKHAQSEKDRVGKTTLVKNFDKRIFIRKNQSHFDWDWGPEIPYSGITKDIYIDYGKNMRIVDFLVEQTHGDNYVSLDVSFAVQGNISQDSLNF